MRWLEETNYDMDLPLRCFFLYTGNCGALLPLYSRMLAPPRYNIASRFGLVCIRNIWRVR